MLAIYKKELRTYFTSFSGYIFLAGFVFLMALFFYMINIAGANTSFAQTLSGPNTQISFLVLIPILTMQLFSEETKQRTDQLLYTSPTGIPQIVIGKFLGAFSLFFTGVAITLLFPLIIGFYAEVPLAETAGAYLGFVLMGLCFIAVGLFVSCLTNNTAVAAVGSFAALFLFYVMDAIAAFMPISRLSSAVFLIFLAIAVSFIIYDATKNIVSGIIFLVLAVITGIIIYIANPIFYDAVIRRVLNWFSVLRRYGTFSRGILALADVVYYLAFSAAFIYLTINTIEKRRWK
ncbi:MAG: ABC transporter permease [Defluviitaleaceae bacterium]|nr:ABC transporter permease [Defluviitaleaceae bacterium]